MYDLLQNCLREAVTALTRTVRFMTSLSAWCNADCNKLSKLLDCQLLLTSRKMREQPEQTKHQ